MDTLGELDEPETRARLERIHARLGLFPASPAGRRAPVSPLAIRAASALGAALPPTLFRRERLLLARTEEIARNVPLSIASYLEACLYLSLIACGLAKNANYTARRRELALVAAVGFAAAGHSEARAALGVDERLGLLALDPSLDARTRALAVRLLDDAGAPAGLLEAVEERLAILEDPDATSSAASRST
jgi:hypothetical protein